MKKEYMNPKVTVSFFDIENIVTDSSIPSGVDGADAAAKALGNIETNTMKLNTQIRIVY